VRTINPHRIGRVISSCDLRTYELQIGKGSIRAATLANPDPAARALLPDLYEPVLTIISPQAIELCGFERHEGADGR